MTETLCVSDKWKVQTHIISGTDNVLERTINKRRRIIERYWVLHTCICLIGTHSRFTTFHLQTTSMTTCYGVYVTLIIYTMIVKGWRNFVLVDAMKVEERVVVQNHLLLTSARVRRKWSVSRPTALLPWRDPDIPTEQKTGWAFSNLCNGYQGVFPQLKSGLNMRLTTHLQRMPR